MTGCTFPAVWAVTCKTVAAILAGTTIPASAWFAMTTTQRACFALPATPTDAREICHAVYAGTVIAAGLFSAFIHIWKNINSIKIIQIYRILSVFFILPLFLYFSLLTLIAKVPAPTLSTGALEGIKHIDARAAIQTRIVTTVVNVLVAMHASITRIADASAAAASTFSATWCTFAAATVLLVVHYAELLRVMRDRIRTVLALPLYRAMAIIVGLRVEARRRVAAWIRTAVITIDLALVASKAHRTYALVSVHQISAFSAVLAWFGCALVNVHVAILAGIAGSAAAVIVVHQVNAKRAVLTLAHTVIDVLRAILTSEAAPASATVDNKKRNYYKICLITI